MKLEELAGCLVVENGKVLMVKEAKDNYWKIPSGKIDYGESAEETAVRETREETGFNANLRGEFGTYIFIFKNRNFRLRVYKASINSEGEKRERDNVKEVEWISINKMASGENDIPSNRMIYLDLLRGLK